MDMVANFMLVLPRVGGIVAVAPIFSGRYPALVKAGLSAALALVLVPLVRVAGPVVDGPALVAVIVAELGIGLTIGFVATMVFSAVQVAGQIFDMEMGFGIVNVIDPQHGTQVPLVGSFLHTLTLITFLALDGHHLLLAGLVKSFESVPIGQAVFGPDLSDLVVTLFRTMFVTAVKIALPVAGAMFCVNVALGVIAKATPQMNVFVIGLPVKILGGLIILALGLMVFGNVVHGLIASINDAMISALRLMGR